MQTLLQLYNLLQTVGKYIIKKEKCNNKVLVKLSWSYKISWSKSCVQLLHLTTQQQLVVKVHHKAES